MRADTALVTGIAGFAGTYLAEHLLDLGLGVFGTTHRHPLDESVARRCRTFPLDLRDADELRRIVRLARPGVIFHLAGHTSDAASFQDPEQAFSVNVTGTLHLLEAARSLEEPCRVVLIGSSAVYGRVPDEDQPIEESVPHRPLSPYGVSKAAQMLLGGQYVAANGLDVIRVIPFNHTGPRQSAEAALPAFARQIADAESGWSAPAIHVGDLSPRRDILDVRDVVRAYFLLAAHGRTGDVYHVCSGTGTTMRELLDRMIGMSPLPRLTTHTDPARLRPASIPAQVGSCARLRAATGWSPRISIDTMLWDLLEYWRGRQTRRRWKDDSRCTIASS